MVSNDLLGLGKINLVKNIMLATRFIRYICATTIATEDTPLAVKHGKKESL